ncbi:MAG: DNA double-strand break repair nuclease NurA [Desulfurococcales archaeon]|nr:DNA double-strand break repair nuclease NurA [Desulfurococcales archaeon]
MPRQTGILYGRDPSIVALAAREAAARARLLEPLEKAARILERLQGEGLLAELEPAPPSGPVYGLDGGLARLSLGGTVLAVLHAAAVRVGEGDAPAELHAAAALHIPGAGVEAEEAVSASLSYLEASLLERLAREAAGAQAFMLDGPVADPPWEPRGTRQLEEAGVQLAGRPDAVLGVHGKRAGLLEAYGDRVVGVVKRLTSPRPPEPLPGLGLEGPEDAALRSLLAALAARGHGGCWLLGPVEPPEPSARLYRGLAAGYILCPSIPALYRLEALGDRLTSLARLAAALTPPGLGVPAPVAAAHQAARAPREMLYLALSEAGLRLLEEAGTHAGEALLALLPEQPEPGHKPL